MSIKNSNDTIGNRTRDLPTCSSVPQPTAPPRASPLYYIPWLNLMAALKSFKPTANRDFYVPTDDTSLPACDAVSVEWFWRFKTTQCYDMIYLLTAIGWSRGGSTHLHTNNTENNTNKNRTKHITTNVEERGPCPVFASYNLVFALQLRKRHGKTSVITEKPYVSWGLHIVQVLCWIYHADNMVPPGRQYVSRAASSTVKVQQPVGAPLPINCLPATFCMWRQANHLLHLIKPPYWSQTLDFKPPCGCARCYSNGRTF